MESETTYPDRLDEAIRSLNQERMQSIREQLLREAIGAPLALMIREVL